MSKCSWWKYVAVLSLIVIAGCPAKQEVTVPDLTGLGRNAAELSIASNYLRIGVVAGQYSDTAPEGQVLSQTPAAGTRVPSGTEVGFTVASGPAMGWQKSLAPADFARAGAVQQTADGGYMVAGDLESETSGDQNMYLAKLDSAGNTVWQGTYTAYDAETNAAQQTADGGYALAGTAWNEEHNMQMFCIIKIDSSGYVQDSATLAAKDSEDFDYSNCLAMAMKQTSDGGFVLAGYVYTGVDVAACVLKVDANLDEEWIRLYGLDDNDDYLYAIVQTPDGGYAAAGNRASIGSYSHATLLKLDSSGDEEWTQSYQFNDVDGSNDIFRAMDLTSDGGFILAGHTHRSWYAGSYMVKTDSNGNVGWEYSDAGDHLYEGFAVKQTPHGAYVVAGNMTSDDDLNDMAVIKLSTTGLPLWRRSYSPASGESEDVAMALGLTSDGGCIIAGTGDTENGSQALVVKTTGVYLP